MAPSKKRTVIFTEREYLERLQLLLNTITFKTGTLILTGNSVKEAALLSQEFANHLLNSLDSIVDTDFTLELKEGILNMWVLARFLDISLSVIIED